MGHLYRCRYDCDSRHPVEWALFLSFFSLRIPLREWRRRRSGSPDSDREVNRSRSDDLKLSDPRGSKTYRSRFLFEKIDQRTKRLRAIDAICVVRIQFFDILFIISEKDIWSETRCIISFCRNRVEQGEAWVSGSFPPKIMHHYALRICIHNVRKYYLRETTRPTLVQPAQVQ